MSAGQITQGRRIYPGEDGKLHFDKPGDYGKLDDGVWKCRFPNWTDEVLSEWAGVPMHEFCVEIGKHSKTEHEDGTLTCSPSILWGADYGMGLSGAWHGYLERGVWREV